MNTRQDAPLRKTVLTNAPATAILIEGRRADSVRIIFEEKYGHYCLLAFRYVVDWDDAKDIVADAFEGALRTWTTEKFESILNLEAYLYRAIRNSAINVAKRKKRLISTNDFPLDTLLVTNPMENFDLDIDRLLQQLPNKQRAAFALFLEGYSHKEIAQKLAITEGASKNLIYYAKDNLKKLLNDLPEFDPDDRGPSANRSSKAKRTTHKTRTTLHTNSGSTPKVKDLLNYLNGYELKASNKKAILQWLVYEDYAIEIITGLRFALIDNNAKEIASQLKKDKDRLRKQLFGSCNHSEHKEHLACAGSTLTKKINNWDLAIDLRNNEPNKHECPMSYPALHFYNIESLKETQHGLSTHIKSNRAHNSVDIVEQQYDYRTQTCLPFKCSLQVKNNCNLNYSNKQYLNKRGAILKESDKQRITPDFPIINNQFIIYIMDQDFRSHTHLTQNNKTVELSYQCIPEPKDVNTFSAQIIWKLFSLKK